MPLSAQDVVLRLIQFAVVATIFGAAAASGVRAGRKLFAFALVAALAQALLIALWRAWRGMIAFPRDEYGPLPDDRERLERHLHKVGRANRNLVQRWKVQGRIRTALERARQGGDLERVEGHLERAREQMEEWRRRFRPARGERAALERRFRSDWEALRTIKYVNAAQALLEHARGLKTERGREGARRKAQRCLDQGLADEGADDELLLRFGRESGLLREGAPSRDAQPSLLAADGRWVAPDQVVTVHGRKLRGPLWIGERLPAGAEEPSLIDPNLPVAKRPGRAADGVPDDPSYRDLTPSQRGAFLDWLAADGPGGEVPRGFPRLVLYALERRLLQSEDGSTQVRREVDHLVRILERLALRHQGRDRRLAAAARSLALYACLRFPFEVQDEASTLAPPSATGETGSTGTDLPARLRIGLARRISAGRPIPASWARAWLHHAHPGELRTPARRAPEDFERLFGLRYRERFGEGLVVPPGAAALRALVRPLSPAFAGERFQAHLDLPDPWGCADAPRSFGSLADSCCEELTGLSRFLGRSDGRRPDLKALATLPRELLAWHDEPVLESLRTLLESGARTPSPWLVQARPLAALWPGRAKLARADCARYATLLGKLGFGVEPDPRFGGPPWPQGGCVALFPLASDAPRAPSRAYEAATLVVHVAVALAASDRDAQATPVGAEEEALREHLQTNLNLPSAERRRLEVHMTWLRHHPPRLIGLQRRVDRIDQAGRDRLADFLLRVAGADGRVSPAEVRLLERAYVLLGREAGQVHRDLHRRSSGRAPTSPISSSAPAAGEIALDPARLAQKLAETRRVAALLGDVFQQDDGDEDLVESAHRPAQGPTYAGLDAAHSAFLAQLSVREEWARADVEELAEKLDLMPDGALDQLNDVALGATDDPLWEGDDPLWVDLHLGALLMAS